QRNCMFTGVPVPSYAVIDPPAIDSLRKLVWSIPYTVPFDGNACALVMPNVAMFSGLAAGPPVTDTMSFVLPETILTLPLASTPVWATLTPVRAFNWASSWASVRTTGGPLPNVIVWGGLLPIVTTSC